MEKRTFTQDQPPERDPNAHCIADVALGAKGNEDYLAELENAAQQGSLFDNDSRLNIPCKLGACSVDLYRENGTLIPIDCPRHDAVPQ